MEHLFQTSLELFSEAERQALAARVIVREVRGKSVPYVRCVIRGKEIQLKPEEVVRQLFAAQLLQKHGYPKARIAFEYPVAFGREKKSADIVVFDKDRPDAAYILVETKKPKLKDGKEQLKSYCHATGAPIAVWTNGGQVSFYHRKDPNYFEDIPGIPAAHQKLSDILTERWTIDDLRSKDKLVTERKSLKSLVLEMEDEVLANAGVDVFEELFKLIFTKLYDEMCSGRDASRYLQFRNYGDTESELKEKIHALFTQAKQQWEGVFTADSKIELTAAHLSICVSSLQDVKLFNSNLEVVDEAFEYLISKSSKGEKGQYFTPRYVIDMCVKMLNPQAHETLIDTAAGSCGFPVHGIFHVWEQILKEKGLTKSHLFSAEHKPQACTDYVNDKVFAIDFDEKAVRVARTLNLIAGDGQTNVLHLNTLDWPNWDQTVKEEAWIDTYHNGWKKLRKLKSGASYRDFEFDILMANPPFAGDIKQSALLSQYELARDPKGKLKNKVGRDILFIERNLNFLKPGGRMAIVLPQGRFNNASDATIRHWLAEHGRILAVVGLHGNVFKPHTGTKTSVLFFQKWHDTHCPRVDDYPIFFATMQKPSKDNSGEKIYLKNEDGSKRLDSHGHLVVDHDLFNHEGMTEDGIAEAFIEFAKKEKLGFFLSSECGFDEGKYRGLLERLEVSEVLFSNLNLGDRYDAEFFTKQYLSIDKCLNPENSIILEKLGKFVASAFYPPAVHLYDSGDTPFIRCVDCINFPMITRWQDNLFEKLPQDFVNEQKGINTLRNNDIVITKVGTPSYASIVLSPERVALSRTVLGLKSIKNINPFYLLAFLRSKYGFSQLQRHRELTIQYQLTIERVKKVKVFKASHDFQKTIEGTLFKHIGYLGKAREAYTTAQNRLLSELNLSNYQPSLQNTAICNFQDSLAKTDRLDAEYYQPRYAQMVSAIKSYAGGYKTLGDCVKLIKGEEVGADAYQDDGVPFIRVSNISPFGLTEEKYISEELYQTLQHCQPEQNDILISKDASPGVAYHLSETPKKMVISGGVLRLQKTTDAFNHASLTLILNSILVKEQINRDAGGSVILHWRPDQVQDTLIPIIPEALQETIKENLDESKKLRQQSQTLLQNAKHAVELAIEHDEAYALDFLSRQA